MGSPRKEKPDLQKKVHEVAHKPGVYLMRDRYNRVIYVGKARDLRKRVSSYFLPSKLAQADLKTRAMLEATWDFETHIVRSEAESVLLEGKLIKEYRPRYNVSFRDDKRFLLVKIDLSEEWPRFRLARFKKDDGARYFGPYPHAGALRQTLNFMRKKFGVLTFGRGSPTERELKSSTYQVPVRLSEIGAEQYRERVPHPPRVMECFDISNISTTHVVASMVCFRDGVPDKDNYRRYRVRTVGGQDDFASMAEVVRRRYSRVLLDISETGNRRSESTDANAIVDLSPEHSQENAFDTARRMETYPLSAIRYPQSVVRLPHLIIVDGGN